MSLSFDPEDLPDPATLSVLRKQNRVGAPLRPAGRWYTPMLLFGQVGTPLVPDPLVHVGRIPIIETCRPMAWYLSTTVPATLVLQIDYAPPPPGLNTPPASPDTTTILLEDNPVFIPVTVLNNPHLLATSRAVYEEVPWITGWPQTLFRYSELKIYVLQNDLADEVLLTLYLSRLNIR